ncbi:MAG: acetate--CoA ligase [Deltaproteobacteria bacterium]|nr:acetate--CoA ligase [Deltaproteobacteria bacterium]
MPSESIEIPLDFHQQANLNNLHQYQALYRESVESPEEFWGKIAKGFSWFKPWTQVLKSEEMEKSQWFVGGKTNLCVNALDRHLKTLGNKTALLWIGNEEGVSEQYSYLELYRKVCQLANALKTIGVQKGDRVAIYLGMVPELPISLLACARIGAIHNVIFGGFSAESLKERIQDCEARFVLTADGLYRGNKTIPLKNSVDQALEACTKEGHVVEKCLVLRHTQETIEWNPSRDLDWKTLVNAQALESEPEWMDAEDPLFILYTSGSTGKPKGVLHTTAGYMIYVATTFRYVFDIKDHDRFWCTADVGWVTGHSYVTYGPLLNGATTVLFEGVPHYPNPDRLWKEIDRHKITILYTAPTALRALMREGNSWVSPHSLDSLRLLGTVGEPINPKAWLWYFEIVGKKRCPIVDTWWQTETGGIMVTTLPGCMSMKPGSAGLPFFGVAPKIIREDGSECEPNESGNFILAQSWPSMIRGVYKQPDRVHETYFSRFPPFYFAGDGAKQDSDGFIWFLGRVDDVLNVSGHRIGTAEVESALVKHPQVAEAAVVGFPHEIKGQGIFAFVILKRESSSISIDTLKEHVSQEIGAIAKPDQIRITSGLPKTRSGKIMRRILRKIAEGQTEDLGDLTTLADPGVVDELLRK